MAIAQLLSMLGVGGSLATVATAAVALYHGRSILNFLTRVGTWLRIAGLVAFLLVIAAAGLIPGVDLAINLGTLAETLGSLWGAIPKPSLPEVLP